MQKPPPPTNQVAALRNIAELDFELAKLDVLERLKFQASFAQSAWQSLTLVNGGAIVALFTFIGSAKPDLDHIRIWFGFVCFSAGLTLNILSILTGFLAQAYFMRAMTSTAWNEQAKMHGHKPQFVNEQNHEMWWGNCWEVVAIGTCFLSLVAFVVGSAFSLAGVSVG